jgi:hypothetical protein
VCLGQGLSEEDKDTEVVLPLSEVEALHPDITYHVNEE